MKILTLNMKATDKSPRKDRYGPLAGLISVGRYDVMMFQEDCGGISQLTNSTVGETIRRTGEDYHRTSRTMSHWCCWPFINYNLVTASRIIPERVISSNLGTRLGAPNLSERYLWSAGSRALAVLINKVWYVNVHLDYTQGEAGFFNQANHMHLFMLDLRAHSERIVFAGDFNADPVLSFNPVHQKLHLAGYQRSSTGCTYGYDNNPYGRWLHQVPSAPDSIYISPRLKWISSDLVLNYRGAYVSDHVGVEGVFEWDKD